MAITSDFRFWEERSLPIHRQRSGDYSSSDYIEFRVQRHHDQDQDQASPITSPPLWTKVPKNSTHETRSPLLPHDHHFSSCLSPTSRSRAISDGRLQLMEMIKDLPESSFELSLKDIVEECHADEVVKEIVLVEEKKTSLKIKKRIIQRKNDNDYKNTGSKICRSESMESGVFLLKMFLPASLIGSKKRSDKRKWPIQPQPAPEGSEKLEAGTKWWKIMFLFVRGCKKRRHIRRSNSEISSGKNRLVDGTDMPCKWSLCIHRKCRSSGQRDCLF